MFPVDVGNLISGFPAFSKTRLNIWKSTVHVLLNPGLENVEHYFSVSDECNCAVVWALLVIAFLWNWNQVLSHSKRWEPLEIFFFFLRMGNDGLSSVASLDRQRANRPYLVGSQSSLPVSLTPQWLLSLFQQDLFWGVAGFSATPFSCCKNVVTLKRQT